MQITITLPDLVTFESRDIPFEFAWDKVPEDKRADFVAACAVAGIMKAGVDAASSAKTYADENNMTAAEATKTLVGKRMAVWAQGDWASRAGGMGDSPEVAEAKTQIRAVVKTGDAKKYKNASPEERTAMVDAHWDALPEDQKAAYIRTATARLAVKARMKAELSAIKTDVKL
jgi:hypothetical protein